MSNLKKILALVLALVMTMSFASAAEYHRATSFADDQTIDADYYEAVAVLNGMKIFQGDNLNNFNPKANITRQEVAAMMYRIVSHDTADKQDELFKDACTFDDVTAEWAKGFIGYCANGGYIKGVGNNCFAPTENISGTAVLAMILRAIGYDKNNEFTGPTWEKNVLAVATSLGILAGIDETVVSLALPATRELVAQLIFNAMTSEKAYKVTYTPAFTYQPVLNNIGATATTLGDEFALEKTATYSIDKWGRPGYSWTYNVGAKKTTFKEIPLQTYTTAVTECQIAADLGLTKATPFTLFTNGDETACNKLGLDGKTVVGNSSAYEVQPTDTVQTLGAQGTITEVYESGRIVVIDTFLALVADVDAATFDAAGHLKTPSTLTLYVFDNSADDLDGVAGADKYNTVIWEKSDASNWEYVPGQYLLLNAWTDNTVNHTTGDVTVTEVHDNAGNNKVDKYSHIEILGEPTAIEGTQTVIWNNIGKHIINGDTYADAKWFKLDQAGKDTTAHTWMFDENNNLIGVVDIATIYNYGIIEKIQWFNPQFGFGYATATIRYMDNTTEDVVVSTVETTLGTVKTLAYAYADVATGNLGDTAVSLANGYVSTVMQNNFVEWFGTDLFRVEDNADGTVSLRHVTYMNATVETKAEAANATIKTGSSYIWNGTTGTLVNTNTVFMVRTPAATGWTYSIVTGYENIANYTYTTAGTGAQVDWVDLNKDGYAEYVYVTGTPDAANTDGLFYLTSYEVEATLKVNGDVDYYTVKGYLNGVYTELKVDNAKDLTPAGTNDYDLVKVLVPNMAPAGVNNTLNTMFYVQMTNGVVTAAPAKIVADDADLMVAATTEPTLSNIAYTGLALEYTVTTDADAVVLNGTSLQIGSKYFNISGLTPVFGDALEQGVHTTTKNIYVIYDKNVLVNGAYIAKAIYVDDIDDQNDPSGDGATAPTTTGYEVTVANNNDTFTVVYKEGGNATNVAENVFFSYVAYVNGTNVKTATNCLLVQGDNTVTIDMGLTLTAGSYDVVVIVTIGDKTITDTETVVIS